MLFSVRTIFNLEEAHKIFLENPDNHDAYITYMRDTENEPLAAGPLLKLYQTCELMNSYSDELGYTPFNIGMCGKDDLTSNMRIYNNIGEPKHNIRDAAYHSQPHGGAAYRSQWIRRYFNNHAQPSVFFTCNEEDAQMAVDDGMAASRIIIPENASYEGLKKGETFDWWFDLDAVAWGTSAEVIYKKSNDKDRFLLNEWRRRNRPIEKGPYTDVLTALTQVNRDLEFLGIESPLKLHFCTARGGRAIPRAVKTMHHYNIDFNGSHHFMAGESKSNFLDIVRTEGGADLFLDDQMRHLEPMLVEDHLSCGHVPYAKGSSMDKFLCSQANKPS